MKANFPLALLISLVCAPAAWAEDSPRLEAIQAAVAKSLPLLEAGAKGSMAERKQCFTCHNQGLPILALTTARDRGFEVDAAHLQTQLQFIGDFLGKNKEKYLEGKGTGGQADTAGYALWTLDSGSWKPDETTAAVAEYLLKYQQDSDHWKSGARRPPSEQSSFTVSYLALRGLKAYGTPEQQERIDGRFSQVREWLLKAAPEDTEDRVFRLRGLHVVSAPEEEVRAAREALLETQRADGGWSQLADLESDAYATGSTLVALHQAGGLATDDPAFRKGLSYLLSCQQDDGSWHVVSRSKPFQAYFESGYPHGKDQFISIAAAGWATMALALALPERARAGAATQLGGEAAGFLKTYCMKCHQGEAPKGKLDLAQFQTAESVTRQPQRWAKIVARVQAGEMPPEGSKKPGREEQERFVGEVNKTLLAALCESGPHPGPAPLRRLNRTQYGATLRDLLGIQASLGQLLPEEGAGGEGFDNAAETLFLSPLHAEKYFEAACAALDYGSKDSRSRRAFLTSRPGGESRRGRREESSAAPDDPPTSQGAQAILERFIPRAFRRPAREGEVEQYLALFEGARTRGEPFEPSLLFAMQGALISPHFLFRLEEPNPDSQPRLVGDYEIASRLSYFLWDSMPDDELFRLAAEGKLKEPEVLREQAVRMLKDRKTRESAESFVEQWLGTRELGRNIKPDRAANRYSNELEWALKQEPVLFFQHVLSENRPLLDFLDADYTFLDSKLQRHYRLQVSGTNQQLKRFDLPEGSHRGGLLGMAGVLAVTSLPHRTSPVLRGKWVRETLLGSPTPPPPPNVPQLDEKRAAATPQTIRELLQQHRENAQCAVCHSQIDPIGFGLENYDLLGRWRTEEAGKPIDAQGQLPDGAKFNGPDELKQVLLQRKDDFIRHLTTKMLGYALGRGLTIEDKCTVDEIVKKVQAGEYRSQVLIAEIVSSVPFRYRAPDGAPQVPAPAVAAPANERGSP